ncbi:MAG: GDSL-type esterase/lipase family protein, partial [Bacteroidales bacterium]
MALTYQAAIEQTITAGEQIHQIVNGTATTEVTVEDGSKVPSIRKALLDNFYFKDPIAWQAGQTEVVFNQLRKFTDGSWWYAPSATVGNPISMGSTPVGNPLWKIYDFDAIGRLEPRIDEALIRSYDEAGYNLATGSFEKGGTLNTSTDVLLYESNGKAYLWTGALPKSVPPASSPYTTGGVSPTGSWEDVSSNSLKGNLAVVDSDVIIAGIPAKDIANQSTFHYFERYGAVGDGVTDNTSAFLAARTELGVEKVCRLSEGKTYYFSGSRPDLSGLAIYAELGAKIKTDANPNIKTMTLVNDVTINNTVHKTTLIKHGNVSHDYLVSAGAAINRLSGQKLTKKLFTDSDVTLSSINGIASKGAFTGTNSTSYIGWGSDFAANQQGAFITFEQNILYEAAFRHIGTVIQDVSSFRSVSIVCGGSQRVDFAVYPGTANGKLIAQGLGAESISVPLPNGGAYSLSNDGAITLGVRVVGNVAEFYVNGLLLKKYTLLATPTEVAFLTSYVESSKCQIMLPTKTSCVMPNSSNPKKIAIVGDSISYGAWASESYDSILAKSLEHCGVGGVTSVNYAVSGTSTTDWIAGGSIDITTKNVSDCAYTLIMLGTNDVQGGVTGTQYETNMRAIIANVIAQGSRPVLGVFPVWTQTSVSGVTGVTTQNYAKGGWHRQIIKMLAAEL